MNVNKALNGDDSTDLSQAASSLGNWLLHELNIGVTENICFTKLVLLLDIVVLIITFYLSREKEGDNNPTNPSNLKERLYICAPLHITFKGVYNVYGVHN